MMDEGEKRVVQDNLALRTNNATVEKELREKERNKLKYEVDMLKHMQKISSGDYEGRA
jgi:flagellar basal body-associated protein FliL